MEEQSRKGRLSSKKLTDEQVEAEKLKLLEGGLTGIRNRPQKDIPYYFKAPGLIYKFMKTEKLNLYEAMDKVLLMHPDRILTPQIESTVRMTLDHEEEINYICDKVKILEASSDIEPFLLKTLMAELLWGRYFIRYNLLEILYLKYYDADIREMFLETLMVFDSAEDSYSPNLPVYIRINTLAISLEAAMTAFHEEGWNLLPRPSTYKDFLYDVKHLGRDDCIRDFHISELIVFPAGTSFYDHPGYLDGKFFIEDKGSCLSAFLLNPKPGSRVLDMCAAPGFKTNHIANMMKNEGIIYACEKCPERYNRFCTMMDQSNVTCVEPIHGDCCTLEFNDLNYILLDYSSSYTGIFYKKDIVGMNPLLRHVRYKSSMTLQYALLKFPSVKRVVYSVCSIYAEEGERVVTDAMKKVGDAYSLLDVREMLWNEWITVGQTSDEYLFSDKCLRTNPEFDLCHGYFIAVFERNFSVPLPPYIKKEPDPAVVEKNRLEQEKKRLEKEKRRLENEKKQAKNKNGKSINSTKKKKAKKKNNIPIVAPPAIKVKKIRSKKKKKLAAALVQSDLVSPPVISASPVIYQPPVIYQLPLLPMIYPSSSNTNEQT